MRQPSATQQPAGSMAMAHYTANKAGLNLTDTPFAVGVDQATGGYNFEYAKTGGFRKSNTPRMLNSSADAQLQTRGFGLYNTKTNNKALIRMAGSQIQNQSAANGATTAITEDTTLASSSFFTGAGLAHSFMFLTPSSDVLWVASAALSTVTGVYSTTKATANGVPSLTGSISIMNGSGGGSWPAAGSYFYSVVLRKTSTQALSNAALDVEATVVNLTDTINVNLSAIAAVDTTKYDKIYLYRSSLNGVSGFTAGDLVAILDVGTTSYADTYITEASSQTVPRASSVSLDNSQLPSGSYDSMCVWKQRLVVAKDNTVYLSDVNKPESWPTVNTINIPSGGKITALASIGYNHPGGSSTDEFLAVFKDNELWLITGSSYTDFSLKFVDYTGCIQQGLIAQANGFMYWIDRRGAYLWDGAGKPTYISRPVESIWSDNGDLDKNHLTLGTSGFYRPLNQVVWFLSSNTAGQQQYVLKLDLRLTLPLVQNFLGERVLEGVFMQGKTTNYIAAAKSMQSPIAGENKDYLFVGDNSGNTYKFFDDTSGSGNDIQFSYITAHLDQDRPSIAKRYHKVIAWVDNVGNWDLTLDYWADYRVRESEKSSVTVAISSAASSGLSIWDFGYWDVALWDDQFTTLTPIVFNLPAGSAQNNNEGDAIRLRFSNSGSGQPITVNAFSILYSEIGTRK